MRPLPVTPTQHPPGSAGKKAVLSERYARGEQLHHPNDCGNSDADVFNVSRAIESILNRVSTGQIAGTVGIKTIGDLVESKVDSLFAEIADRVIAQGDE